MPKDPDTLAFYSKSADVAPGKGVHEHVTDPAAYTLLARAPHWRRVPSGQDRACGHPQPSTLARFGHLERIRSQL